MKEYTVIIKDDKTTWEETMSVPDGKDPEVHCVNIILDYNHYADANRQFVGFRRQRTSTIKQMHNWTKKSLVTERGGYDKMQCTLCGATGKRYGMGQNGVSPDRGYDRKYCKKKK